MSYEVTATRRRPTTFDDLVGQEFVVATLKNSIQHGRIANAYLFAGPRGIGKTSAARILARCLNCEQGPNADGCEDDETSREISRGRHMDVIEIDGASNTSVNDVRQIRDEVLFAPNSARYKIYIIDEVHMLSNSAFNALLKTIEEPPPYVVFIFATTEVHKVPATIRSRCQQFNFRLIPLEVIKAKLGEAAAEMGVAADEDALFWMAREATGSLRDAYTLFDQVVSFSDGHITLPKIHDKLGLVGFEQLDAMMSRIAAGEAGAAIDLLDGVLASGVSVEQFTIDLSDYIRALLLIKSGVTRESILGLQAERISRSVLQAFDREQLEMALDLLLELYRSLRYSLSERFELELAISRIATLRDLVSGEELVKRIASLRAEMSAHPAPEDTSSSSPGATAAPGPVTGGSAPLRQEPAREEPAREASRGVPFSGTAAGTPLHTQAPDQHTDRQPDPQPGPHPDPQADRPVDPRAHQPATPGNDPTAPAAQAAASAAPSTPAAHAPAASGPAAPQSHGGYILEDAAVKAIVDGVGKKKMTLSSVLSSAREWLLSGETLRITFESEFAARAVREDQAIVTEVATEVLDEEVSLDVRLEAVDEEKKQHLSEEVELVRTVFRGEVMGESE